MFSRDPLSNPEPLIRRVYAYAAYRLGDGPDAEDATSDAFERALRYRDSYDRSRGEPVAWLIGIARRCVDQILADRMPVVEPPDEAASIDLEEETVSRLELSRALAGLSEHDRELMALRYGAETNAYFFLLTDVYPYSGPWEFAPPRDAPPEPEPEPEPAFA